VQALRTRRPAVLGAQRYDISPTGDRRESQVRYWTTTAVPVLDPAGRVTALLYNIHDVTALTQRAAAVSAAGEPRARDLFRAAVEISEQARLFDDTVIAERQLGLAVQDAMLPATIPAALADRVVARYRPASHVLHVGGDWYDVSHLSSDRFAVAVGDVVGHGLTAAVMMGRLRSALNALTLADLGPAEALAGLDRFAHQETDAAASTAVKVIVDVGRCTLTYSSAGHPPGVLVHPDGTTQLLDQGAGPALALPVDTGPRPTAVTDYLPGSRLLLYTDGLVEHRREDIDTSLRRLTDSLRDALHVPLSALADRLTVDVPDDNDDDVALLIVQL
jgi:serine phosphatase RsbU (regulator of sigma subunit)